MNIPHEDITLVAACRNADKLLPGFSGEVRVGDLRDADYLDRMLVGIDIVCHAAGWSSLENSADICRVAYLEPTLDLIQRAIEWRVKRLVNLSSLFVAPARQRNNSAATGKPLASTPMMNCLIAVEDYLRTLTDCRTQFINLRPGIYAGKRMNISLLALLLNRGSQASSGLPYLSGSLGYFPLIDGKDIGQAFARAALAPIEQNYACLNISGPETPEQSEAMAFIRQHINQAPLSWGYPKSLAPQISGPLSLLTLWLKSRSRLADGHSLLSHAMLEMLKCPPINNSQAQSLIGYDPEISWQASLLETLNDYKNHHLSNQFSLPYKPLHLD